jgi:hypothetical protein
LLVSFFFTVLGFELRTLHLLGRYFTTHLNLFALVIFQVGSCVYAWANLGHDPPIYAPCRADMTGLYHCTQLLLVEMGTFCPVWPQTVIFSISAS